MSDQQNIRDPSSEAVPSAAAAQQSRLVARLSAEFILRSLQAAAAAHGGDLTRAVVAAAIVAANTSHLNAGDGGGDTAPTDADRRPVSVLAISQSLGLPFETTRRKVNALIADGVCRRARGGVIIPTETLLSPENASVMQENVVNLRRFLSGLRRAGAI